MFRPRLLGLLVCTYDLRLAYHCRKLQGTIVPSPLCAVLYCTVLYYDVTASICNVQPQPFSRSLTGARPERLT